MANVRQPGGTAFALRDPLAWTSFADVVRAGERRGYAAVFLPEIVGRDAFAALTGLAGETSELLLGTGIVRMTSREPTVTAMGAATVHERSRGRAILGLGTGTAGRGALDALADQITQIRRLLEGGLSLDPGSRVPVWIAALGPRAVRLAGTLADGVLLNWCSPERVAEARSAVRVAAEEAGRDPDEVTVGVYVRAAVDVDPDVGIPALKLAFGEYAGYAAYGRQFAAIGMGDEAEAAAAAFRTGRTDDIPTSSIERICLVGDVGRARARLAAYREAGADLPVVYPALLGGDVSGASLHATLAALAPSV